MMGAVVIALLRFVPLGLLLVFSVLLVYFLVKESAFSTVSRNRTVNYLVVQKNRNGIKPAAGEKWVIDEKIRIGRAIENDIVIDDPYVSTWHAELEKRGDEFWLKDLGSTNGTMLNGYRIDGQKQIGWQDVVTIGGVLLRVERGEVHADCGSNPYRVSEAAK